MWKSSRREIFTNIIIYIPSFCLFIILSTHHHLHFWPYCSILISVIILLATLKLTTCIALANHPFIILFSNYFTKKTTSVLKSILSYLRLTLIVLLFILCWRQRWWGIEEKSRLGRILSKPTLFFYILQRGRLLLILRLAQFILSRGETSAVWGLSTDVHRHRIQYRLILFE